MRAAFAALWLPACCALDPRLTQRWTPAPSQLCLMRLYKQQWQPQRRQLLPVRSRRDAASAPLKQEAAALRKSLADKSTRDEATAARAERWTRGARRRPSRGASRARPSAPPRRARPSTRRAWRSRSAWKRRASPPRPRPARCATTPPTRLRAQRAGRRRPRKRRAEFKRSVEKAKKRAADVAQVWERRDRRTNDRLRDIAPCQSSAM